MFLELHASKKENPYIDCMWTIIHIQFVHKLYYVTTGWNKHPASKCIYFSRASIWLDTRTFIWERGMSHILRPCFLHDSIKRKHEHKMWTIIQYNLITNCIILQLFQTNSLTLSWFVPLRRDHLTSPQGYKNTLKVQNVW